jgi:hypothetical protein
MRGAGDGRGHVGTVEDPNRIRLGIRRRGCLSFLATTFAIMIGLCRRLVTICHGRRIHQSRLGLSRFSQNVMMTKHLIRCYPRKSRETNR